MDLELIKFAYKNKIHLISDEYKHQNIHLLFEVKESRFREIDIKLFNNLLGESREPTKRSFLLESHIFIKDDFGTIEIIHKLEPSDLEWEKFKINFEELHKNEENLIEYNSILGIKDNFKDWLN